MAPGRRPTRFARVPLRARLTIAFAGVMAVLLAVAGAFLYAEFERDLDEEIDSAIKAQAGDIAALVAGRRGPGAVAVSGERFAQVYAGDGRVLASTRALGSARLLTPAEAVRAAGRAVDTERRELRAADARVHAVPARFAGGRRGAVAVGDSLEQRDSHLARLRTLLLIAGPIALLLASVAGYEVAGAALRPVERMRAQAERITEAKLSERLPVGAPRDEIAALGRTLNVMLDRLEAALARERRLVSDASHELRTPLTTLRAEVDLALRGERDADELRAALESAAEEAGRMSRLADDLLVLARADEGRLPLRPEPLAANELIEEAAARARAAAGAQGRSILARVESGSDGRVSADPDRTAQVLDNLVSNALRYGEGTITLTARGDGDLVELHVMDEGPGFPEGTVGRAFERFGRAEQGLGGGSGLGLAIVEAVAVAHGGTAGARNRPEGGADVWIALPRA